MAGLFGGRDPFDDPFFTRPSGNLFGSSMSGSAAAHDPTRAHRSKGPVIQELDSDSEQLLRENVEASGEGKSNDKYQENAWANRNPHVEHPDDQSEDHNKHRSTDKSSRTDNSKVGGKKGQTSSVSFQRVTYGGISGPYYSASTTRRTGSDGMVLEENRQADSTTGQATHRISRGIHDKGHSFTRKLDSDGKVDTTQTLHNLDEDELSRFEQTWKGNADMSLPRWDDGFNFRSNLGSSGALPFLGNLHRQIVPRTGNDPQAQSQARSTGGRTKKVVRIPIE